MSFNKKDNMSDLVEDISNESSSEEQEANTSSENNDFGRVEDNNGDIINLGFEDKE